MKMVNEMRQRQTWEAHKSASPLPIILGAVIAFGIGLLGVSGAVRVPTLLQAKTQTVLVAPRDAAKPAMVAIDTGPRRLGRAEAAPLLKICMPMHKMGRGKDQPIEAADLYRILQAGSAFSRIASATGIKQNAMDDVGFATMWADVADCIYRQNGWMICDPDNRALAVEAAVTLVRQASAAEKTAKTPDTGSFARTVARVQGKHAPSRDYLVQNANAAKSRVLAGLRNYVSEGRLTASDFGMFAPSEITQAVRETTATRDACAARN
jgi:RNase H-fold protein (predicted Holliday junction resolvase)